MLKSGENLLQAYLILVGPESADSQLSSKPVFASGAGDVPDGISQRPFVHPNQDVQSARVCSVLAVQKVAEINAVSIIFFHRWKLESSLFSRVMV